MTSSKSPVLATGISQCCIEGFKHTGDPSGKIVDIAGWQTYISEPATAQPCPKKVLLFLSDVHSSLYINNKLLQDNFSHYGFTVVGPDYLCGDTLDNQQKANPTWRIKEVFEWATIKRSMAEKSFSKWLEAVKAIFGTSETLYFAVGYCFGAPFTCDLAATDAIKAAAIAHPSFLVEDHFKNLTQPLFMSCAEIDVVFTNDKRYRAEEILAEGKKIYHFQLFGSVSHGWTVRGDLDNSDILWAKEESVRGMVGWFNRFAA